jgi:hypothetical protein
LPRPLCSAVRRPSMKPAPGQCTHTGDVPR